jgi:hypothetical protein
MTYSMASKTQMAALFLTDRLMVHPVKMSVSGQDHTELTGRVAPLVSDQVDLDEPGHVLAPLRPGADRDL